MRAFRAAARYLLVALLSAALLLLDIWPWHPTSKRGWLLFVGLALPILVVGQFIGDKTFDNPLSRSVDRATVQSEFSWLRIAYLLAVVILMVVVFATVQHLWRR